jgi:hypothetical protein
LLHVSQLYQKMTSSDTSSNGRTAGTRCMCRSGVLSRSLSYILYISILVWIVTMLQELTDRPT